MDGISVFFLFHFATLTIGMNSFFKTLRSGQKQQTTQSTEHTDHWKSCKNAKSWLVQKWYHTCVNKNGIATGESGDNYRFSHLATIQYTTVFHIINCCLALTVQFEMVIPNNTIFLKLQENMFKLPVYMAHSYTMTLWLH